LVLMNFPKPKEKRKKKYSHDVRIGTYACSKTLNNIFIYFKSLISIIRILI